ncbi:hypothetical protein SUGI_1043370 [Cryptomeria japonica]|nr:hypothetical protein SUGI_1043370 [Cryptomeria japonica]
MSTRKGPPKHQNKFAWKWDAGCKKNETELGGKFRPFSDVTGVCGRCKDQIEWKRKYGKYKPLTEPAKCAHCGKRAVRQAYHMLCSACAKERGVCAKCSHVVDAIIGRDAEEVEVERKQLEEAIKNSRERDRRTLLRAGYSLEKIAGDIGEYVIASKLTKHHGLLNYTISESIDLETKKPLQYQILSDLWGVECELSEDYETILFR